jgi:membrane-bound lytic murein transglycosylase D
MRALMLAVAWLSVLVTTAASAAAGKSLPRPAVLAPAVAFWTRVYTEVDTRGGFVHDNRRLDVVYETVRFDPGAGPREEERTIRAAIERYRDILRGLAQGKRTNLTPEGSRVLALWGEKADNAVFQDAVERVRFQRGQADEFREGLIRSGSWDEHIRKTLHEFGLPEALAVLPHVESSFNPLAQSHAGALGLWQFTRSTGRRFMRIDHVVDERLDPYQSTRAAARLLQYNYSVLKSWPLAITAYNHGVSGMRRAVHSTGTDDIGTIVQHYNGRYFGFASRNFYAAFLAALDVSENPERFFRDITRNPPEEGVFVEVPAYLPADALAAGLGLDIGELRALNPPLQEAVWKGSKYVPKGYRLRTPPVIKSAQARTGLQRVALSDGYAHQKPDQFYKVRPGDTLSGIARRYSARVSELMAMNDLRSRHHIRAGQTLRLPRADAPQPIQVASAQALLSPVDETAQTTPVISPHAPPPAEAGTGDSRSEAASSGDTAATETVARDVIPVETQPELSADPGDYQVADDRTIEVQVGETLGHYAEWLDLHSERLRRLNHLSPKRALTTGKRIRLEFTRVPVADFERRRLDYHRSVQAAFFQRYRITGTCEHSIRAGDNLWGISTQHYNIPLWLLRQYNPDLDFNAILPQGTRVQIPQLERVGESSGPQALPLTASGNSCPATPAGV